MGLIVSGDSSVASVDLVAGHFIEYGVVSTGVGSVLEERHGDDILLVGFETEFIY